MALVLSALRSLWALISAKLGRCPRCWRLSLRWAMLGWAAAALVYVVEARTDLWPSVATLWPVILVWPFSLTALWSLHIFTYGVRAVAWEWTGQGRPLKAQAHCDPGEGALALVPAPGGADAISLAPAGSVSAAPPFARRRVLGVFAKSALFVVALSLSPRAFAQSCECSDGRHNCCSESVLTSCWFCPNTQEWFCCAPGAQGCCNNDGPWCCGKVNGCGGTKGACFN
jgi:hypothetical protein